MVFQMNSMLINIAGKEVMTTSGVKEFIKAAYHAMHGPVKDMPMERCSDETETLSLTAKDVKREGKKIFKKMETQVNSHM